MSLLLGPLAPFPGSGTPTPITPGGNYIIIVRRVRQTH